jgi:Uma2 family endonuclease
MTAEIKRRRFTVKDYYKMAEAGILREDDRVELIEGEIVEMTPIGSQHARCADAINRLLVRGLDPDIAIVRVGEPIRLDPATEPQPDFAVVKPEESGYGERHPTPADVLLLIEVSDTSLRYDKDVKAELYARHGIPELWIVDVNTAVIEVLREPAGGTYQSRHEFTRDDLLSPQAVSSLEMRVSDIFP